MANNSMETDAILSSNWNEAGTLAQGVEKAEGASSSAFTFGLSAMVMNVQSSSKEMDRELTATGVKREDTEDIKDEGNSTSLVENGGAAIGFTGDELVTSLAPSAVGPKEEDIDAASFPKKRFSPAAANRDAGFRCEESVENTENLQRFENKNLGAEFRGRRGLLQHADSMRCLPPRSPSDSGLSSSEDENEKPNETTTTGNSQIVVTLVESLESLPSPSKRVDSTTENLVETMEKVNGSNTEEEVDDSDDGDSAFNANGSVADDHVSLSDQIKESLLQNADAIPLQTNNIGLNALAFGSQNDTRKIASGTGTTTSNEEKSDTPIITEEKPETPTKAEEEFEVKKPRKRGCPCDACQVDDCGECTNCLDKPKFGGKNVKRQRCSNKEKCFRWHKKRGGQGKKKKSQSPPPQLAPRGRRLAASTGTSEGLGVDSTTVDDATDEWMDDSKTVSDSSPIMSRKRRRTPRSLTSPFDNDSESCVDKEQKADDSSPIMTRKRGRASRSSTSLLGNDLDQSNSALNPIDVDAAEASTLTQGICRFVHEQEDNEEKDNKMPVNPYLDGLPDAPKSEFYEEESSWRFHNPPLPTDSEAEYISSTPLLKLEPLPPAPPIPELPQTGYCNWSFDDETRVLLANFRKSTGEVVISREDEIFMLRMMERDDITVISEGLVDDLDTTKWDFDYIKGCSGDEFYHKFRGFQRMCAAQTSKQKRKRRKQKTNNSESKDLETEDETNSAEPEPEQEKKLKTAENMDVSVASGESGDEDRCTVSHKEMDGDFTIKVSDYIRYLDMRNAALERIALHRSEAGLDPVNPSDEDDANVGRLTDTTEDEVEKHENDAYGDEIFTYVDDDGNTKSLNVVDVVLYMIDYDMVKLLPPLYEDFINKFKIPGCLPGGTHCMMNSVNSGGRPFMGPNLYLTPPGSFTHFHQDGHGTVDSGHQCLTGYNEVVMLRRLTERHKQHALQLLHGEGREHLLADMQYDALYGLPHADGYGDRPMWPNNESIKRCKAMNYYPSVFILKPGQHVHINKGRLHAFRKLSPTSLPKNDCHAKLRESVILSGNLGHHEQLCMSVAWDWMFKGITSEGTNREVSSILECARLNRKHMKQSLAIPETSLLHMARNLISSIEGVKRPRLLQFGLDPENRQKRASDNVTNYPFQPNPSTTLLGIFPSLEYVITRHVAALIEAEKKRKMASNLQRVSIGRRPNSWENPEMFSLDPYGNGDFFCKLCSEELSNVYMHCDGCEKILNKDFNICISCHSEERYKVRVQMHPLNPKRHSTINHTGDFKRMNHKRCPCKNGPACLNCGFCAGCSCKCHCWFTLHCRFFNISDEKILLSKAKALIPESLPQFVHETQARLASFNTVSATITNDPNPDLKDAPKSDLKATQQTSEVDDGSEMQGLQSTSSTLNVESQSEKDNDFMQESENSNEDEEDASDADSQVKPENHDMQKSLREKRLDRRNEKVHKNMASKVEESGSTDGEEDESDSDSQVKAENNDLQNDLRKTRLEKRNNKLDRDMTLEVPESLGVTSESVGESPSQTEPQSDCGKDWGHRCQTLVEDVPLPQCPKSKFDLSAAALAYTAPHGTLSKQMRRGGRIEGGLDADSLEEFLRKAKDMKDPSVENLYSLLPANCDVEKDHLRHLYRNFADSKQIVRGASARNRNVAIILSRRETDIISFFASHKLRPTDCKRRLIPYRPLTTIHDIMNDIKRRKYCLCSKYMDNVNKCVGKILELEEYSSDESDSEKRNSPLVVEQDGETLEPVVRKKTGQGQHQVMKGRDSSVNRSTRNSKGYRKNGSASFRLSKKEREWLERETLAHKDKSEVHL